MNKMKNNKQNSQTKRQITVEVINQPIEKEAREKIEEITRTIKLLYGGK